MKFTFTSNIKTIGSIEPLVGTSVIHDEPMLFSASWEFARNAGGPLTRMMLEALDSECNFIGQYCNQTNQHLVIDTRSHMLMKGFRPAIGGWHCDAYPRANRGDQPDLKEGNPSNFHYVGFVSDQEGGVSRTLFVENGVSIDMEVDPDHVWSSVHEQVTAPIIEQKEGEIFKFYQETLHTATPAYANGWRWWFRASIYQTPPRNVIRKQVQVYGPDGLGW